VPKAVHDLAIKLQGKGKSEDSAWAIANSQLSKTTKNDKNVGEAMNDQSPPMTLAPVQKQNTGGWPTSMNPSYANTMGQMREDGMGGMGGQQMPQMPGAPCDICGGPEHPPMDHPYLPRMPNDPMAMTQQQMPMPQLPMQPPPMPPQMPMQQPPQQPPMQTNPAQNQAPQGHEEGGMGSGEYPHGSGGGGQQQAPSGGGQSGGGGQGGGDGGFGGGQMGGGKAPPGPIMSFETVKESIFKQLLDRKVGCGCQKSKKG